METGGEGNREGGERGTIKGQERGRVRERGREGERENRTWSDRESGSGGGRMVGMQNPHGTVKSTQSTKLTDMLVLPLSRVAVCYAQKITYSKAGKLASVPVLIRTAGDEAREDARVHLKQEREGMEG